MFINLNTNYKISVIDNDNIMNNNYSLVAALTCLTLASRVVVSHVQSNHVILIIVFKNFRTRWRLFNYLTHIATILHSYILHSPYVTYANKNTL